MSADLINHLLWPFKALPQDYLVIDTETTGLFDSEGAPGIISLGVVLVSNGKIRDNKEFLFKPHRPVCAEASKVNGFSQQQVQQHPTLIEQWPAVLPWFTDHLLLIHNASFDWPLIIDHCKRYHVSAPAVNGVLCTQRATQPWAQTVGIPCSERGPSLDDLTAYLKLRNLRHTNNNKHGALVDATQTAHVILQLQQLCR